MKIIKAVRKLNFWSRKKKKSKRTPLLEHRPPPPLRPPPPPPCHHHCHQFSPVQPSAPPLPPWLDFEQTHNPVSASVVDPFYGAAGSSSHDQGFRSEIVPELNPVCAENSYQQYRVPNPVYGVPIEPPPPPKRGSDAGAFGCVMQIGVHLVRCFVPCFRRKDLY